MSRGLGAHLGHYSTHDTVCVWYCSSLRVISLWTLSPLPGVIRVRAGHLYI
jgi:hypothetical protein